MSFPSVSAMRCGHAGATAPRPEPRRLAREQLAEAEAEQSNLLQDERIYRPCFIHSYYRLCHGGYRLRLLISLFSEIIHSIHEYNT